MRELDVAFLPVADEQEQQVYRLVVLDGRDSKKMCGVVSLGDILRHRNPELAAQTAERIVA